MQRTDAQVVRVTTGIAAAVALTLTIALPAAWYMFDWRYQRGRLDSELEMQASLISQIVARNPEMWRFETLRIQSILQRGLKEEHDDLHEVRDAAGELVVRSAEVPELEAPIISHAVPIYESGRLAGTIVGQVSVRDLVYQTCLIASFSSLLGFAAFFGLRIMPLRALRRAVQRASHLANHDALTGLPNRALFTDRLEQTLAGFSRTSETAAVLFIDLDHFKDVNDTLGHPAGDLLLKKVVERLSGCLRKTDTLARFGGDEFAILETHLKTSEQASTLAQRVIEVIQEPFHLDGHDVLIGCSIGISVGDATAATSGEASSKELLRKADLALYRAKADGRATYRFFDVEMNRRLLERKALERDLRRALEGNEFRLFYQPQVDLGSNRIVGVEALLRWFHPERGVVDPGAFIGVCEETGLIGPIGEWVLRRACEEARGWGEVHVAVNVSPAQFRQGNLVALVARVLRETSFDPERLELEITEGVLLQDTDAVLGTLRAIKAMGVHIAMDDFGTGYSSLNYLRQFPFDKVKIDRAFVRDLGSSADAAAIVRAVVALSRSLGIRANAEGVETDEQAKRLLEEGCQEVQGFLYGRPVSADDLMIDVDLRRQTREAAE